MRTKRKPMRSAKPVTSWAEWEFQKVATVDPFTLEQLLCLPASELARGTYSTINYTVKKLPGGHYTTHLNRPLARASFLNTSGSSEEESSMGSELEAMRTLANMNAGNLSPIMSSPKRRHTPSPIIHVTNSPVAVPINSYSDADDSQAKPQRTIEESNKIFAEIAAHKRTMHLTGRPGAPINVTDQPFARCLEVGEFELCCFLRLAPLQYLHSRDTLVRNFRRQGFYRKSAAQKMLRIDVNKTGSIYEYCKTRHWLPRDEFDSMTTDPPPLPTGAEQYLD